MTRFTGLCLGIALAFVMALGTNSGAMNYQSDGMGMGSFMLTAGGGAGGAGSAGGGMGGSAGPGMSSGRGGAFGTEPGMSGNTGRSRTDMGADTGNLGPQDMTRGNRGNFGNFGPDSGVGGSAGNPGNFGNAAPDDNFSGPGRFAQPGPNFGPDGSMNPGMRNNFGSDLNR